jgi:hypothetical protein
MWSCTERISHRFHTHKAFPQYELCVSEPVFVSEDFPTFIASVMQLSSVNFLMRYQFKQMAEGLPTFLTHMRWFFSVKF